MESDGEGSVTHWLNRLKEGDRGDPAAARRLCERYLDKLSRVAGARLRAARKPATDEDGEDAALSAFASFFEGIGRNEYPKLDDRDDLWRLLVVIAARKAGRQVEKHRSLKRGGGATRTEADLPRDHDGDFDVGLDALAAPDPTPEFGAIVAEEFERLLDRLGDDDLRKIALWRMEKLSAPEMAAHLDCSVHLVHNKLKLIRKIWERRAP